MRFAMVFPGQGSQAVGMGEDLCRAYPEARAVFDRADAVLGYSIAAICFGGPAERLTETRHAQPALLVHSIAVLRVLEANGIQPAAVAGHSLGEYSALVAAGVLAFDDAIQLVQRRGELMFASGVEAPGTMAAVLGASRDLVESACAAARAHGVCDIANLNAPDQIVISGAVAAVHDAMRRLETGGAKMVKALQVSGAFHSALMREPAAGLARALAATTFADAKVPVVPNVTAAPETRGQVLRDLLARQIDSPVRWEESMKALRAACAEPVLEVGAGSVLRGLLRRIDRAAECTSVGDRPSLDALLAKTTTP